jgi:hypothetical protein
MFLVSTTITATYYVYNEARQFWWRFRVLAPTIRWGDRRFENFMIGVFSVLQQDFVLAMFCFVLAVVAVTLVAFTAQQMYYISLNRTQVELDKIEIVEEKWKLQGVSRKYVHAYSHGLLQNWREFLFPERMARRQPKEYTAEWEADKEEKKRKERPRQSKTRVKLCR